MGAKCQGGEDRCHFSSFSFSQVNTWYSNLGILILQSYTLAFFSEPKWVTSIMFIVSQWLMKCHLPDGSNYHLLMAWHGALLCEDHSIIAIWGNNFISQFELILIHARLLKKNLISYGCHMCPLYLHMFMHIGIQTHRHTERETHIYTHICMWWTEFIPLLIQSLYEVLGFWFWHTLCHLGMNFQRRITKHTLKINHRDFKKTFWSQIARLYESIYFYASHCLCIWLLSI